MSYKDATEPWFGKPIHESGEKLGVADCGMSAEKVFDAPIEGLDRGLFDPDRCYDSRLADCEDGGGEGRCVK